MTDLLTQHTPDSEVALAVHGIPNRPARTRADLLRDAAAVAARLPELRTVGIDAGALAQPSHAARNQVLLVFRQDRYAFAAALLGAWSRGYTVCLPPNQRAQTVTQLLTRRPIQALLHDTAVGGHLSVPDILAAASDAPPLTAVCPPKDAAVVMTSGTTGQSHAWPKTAQQLLSEVAMLARTFELGVGLRYVVTVPPSHLYGLLFGVLLPLTTGSAFCRHTPLLPGEIAASVSRTGAQVLVSVPTHLRAARSILPAQLNSLSWVFSSAGPLDEDTARSFTEAHHKPIFEIFGSTETGGIAWRRRHEGKYWRPFDNVELSLGDDSRLAVRSPFTNTRSDASAIQDSVTEFETADQVRFNPDGSFEHLGRGDGVVKVGGQRVSLPAMEDCLARHPMVEDAAVLAIPQATRGHLLLAAVVGPPGSESDCRAHLRQHFEDSTLPRRFLFLNKLPREANGKLMRTQLLRLFGLGDNGESLTQNLTFDDVRIAGSTIQARVVVPANYVAYSGHFDEYPVLAGAIQLEELVLPLVRRLKDNWTSPRSIRRVKFTGRIEPGDAVDVHVELSTYGCQFSIQKQSKMCAGGELVFEDAEVA